MAKIVFFRADDRFFFKLENWKGYALYCGICIIATIIAIHKA